MKKEDSTKLEDGYHISCFEKGDIIIRTRGAARFEAKYSDVMGTTVLAVVGISESFTDSPVELIAIENNVIYAKRPVAKDEFDREYVYKLKMSEYADNWTPFIIPDGLTLEQCL